MEGGGAISLSLRPMALAKDASEAIEAKHGFAVWKQRLFLLDGESPVEEYVLLLEAAKHQEGCAATGLVLILDDSFDRERAALIDFRALINPRMHGQKLHT